MRAKSAPFLPEKSVKGGLSIISTVTSYFCKELGMKLLERASFLKKYEFRDNRLNSIFGTEVPKLKNSSSGGGL